MKKALLVATVSGFIPQFEMNNVHILENMGYEIHYASNFHMPSYGDDNERLKDTGIVCHQIDFCRSPCNLRNWKAYRQLVRLMKWGKFQLIHCHTPMGSVLGRLAAHRVGGAKVIYTAHGFHFYQGAPMINWLVYYPVERFLARYTDELLCITREDYVRAKKFPAGRVNYIPGVGIDLEEINAVCMKMNAQKKSEKRRELNIPEGQKILLSVGELIPRKNHEVMIRALKHLSNLQLCYVICGHGKLKEYLEELAVREGVSDRVVFCGYRKDVLEIYSLAVMFILPSLQEGLSVALMEAMACGVPAIGSSIRGNGDLLGRGIGFLVKENYPEAYAKAIRFLLKHQNEAEQMKKSSLREIKRYDAVQISKKMKDIYDRVDR